MKTLLIAVEDASIGKALARIVEHEGWYAIAADPRRADDLLENVSFDVVLSDWFLSTRTAETMLKALREHHYVKRVIVMSSDSCDERLLRLCAQSGFRLLPKPFTMDALRRALAETIAAAPQAARAQPRDGSGVFRASTPRMACLRVDTEAVPRGRS